MPLFLLTNYPNFLLYFARNGSRVLKPSSLAKQSFERFARDIGVKNIHYHADNGRFTDNGFIQACKDNNQGLTYCGVNAHFQNGMAEKRIRDLQAQATKCSCSQCVSGLACFQRPYGCMHYEQPMKCAMQLHLRVK